MSIAGEQPTLDYATIELAFSNGKKVRYIIHEPTDAQVSCDRGHDEFDMVAGLDPPVIPRPFGFQIGFAFALPVLGSPDVHVERFSDFPHQQDALLRRRASRPRRT